MVGAHQAGHLLPCIGAYTGLTVARRTLPMAHDHTRRHNKGHSFPGIQDEMPEPPVLREETMDTAPSRRGSVPLWRRGIGQAALKAR